MVVRFYSSTAQETTLVGSINSIVTTMTVAAVTGFPATTPYTLAIDYETASEELVTVTGTSGTLLTITRGFDGTSATSHNAGAKVRHVSSAFDYSTSRSHENASTDVHGVGPGAAIVSTTATQTLSAKTLTAPLINNGTFNNITTGAWTTYVPTWKTTSGAVTLGDGTIAGKYSKVGRMVTLEIIAQRGGTTTFDNNASSWQFGLPFTAAMSANEMTTGTGGVEAIFAIGLAIAYIRQASSTGHVSATEMPGGLPWNADNIPAGLVVTISITYEATS